MRYNNFMNRDDKPVTKADIQDIADSIHDLTDMVAGKFDDVDKKFDKVDERFDRLERKFDNVADDLQVRVGKLENQQA